MFMESRPELNFVPGLSIIVPCFNDESNLPALFFSLEHQRPFSFPWEVIVVDDCSAMPIRPVQLPRSSNFSLIRLEKNSGPFFARIRGLRQAKYSYLMFLDSDDCVSEDCFSCLDEQIHKGNNDFVFFDMKKGLNQMRPFALPGLQANDKVISAFCAGKIGYSGTKIVKNKPIVVPEKILNERFLFAEDSLLTMFFLTNSSTGWYVNKALYYYKEKSGSLSGSFSAAEISKYWNLISFERAQSLATLVHFSQNLCVFDSNIIKNLYLFFVTVSSRGEMLKNEPKRFFYSLRKSPNFSLYFRNGKRRLSFKEKAFVFLTGFYFGLVCFSFFVWLLRKKRG